MGFIELLLIAVSMSMDAFAVSICKGLSVGKVTAKQCLSVGGWFGGFQGVMPVIGFVLTSLFASLICSVSHWIAFGLLVFIGGNMIHESFEKDDNEVDASFAFMTMLTLAVATSIDALAMGVTLNLSGANIWLAAPMIAITTAILSPIGLKVGNLFGTKYKNKAELIGGIVLIGLGINILLEGLGIL